MVELAFAGRYGYHRDELYFLACARQLAWGYVDQPPLTPALAWLAVALFGDSLVGLRLFPALSGGAVVMLAGLMARELGGELTLAGRIANAYGVDNQERGAPIWLCRQQRGSWGELWPSVKHYN